MDEIQSFLTKLKRANKYLIPITPHLLFCATSSILPSSAGSSSPVVHPGSPPLFTNPFSPSSVLASEVFSIKKILKEFHQNKALVVNILSEGSSGGRIAYFNDFEGGMTMEVRYVPLSLSALIPLCSSVRSWLSNAGGNQKNSSRTPEDVFGRKEFLPSSTENIVVINCALEHSLVVLGAILSDCFAFHDFEQIKELLSQFARKRQELDSTQQSDLQAPEKRFLSNFYSLCTDPSFSRLLNQRLQITQLLLSSCPTLSSSSKLRLFFMVFQGNDVLFNSLISERGAKAVEGGQREVSFAFSLKIQGDFLIRFFNRTEQGAPEKLFEIATNTAFLPTSPFGFKPTRIHNVSPNVTLPSDFLAQLFFEPLEEKKKETEPKDAGHQMDEDERMARVLQEQFEAEARARVQASNPSPSAEDLGQFGGIPEGQDIEQYAADDALARQLQQEFYNEVAGSVTRYGSAGISYSKISVLPTSVYRRPSFIGRADHQECQVCRLPFEPGEMIRTLPCFHFYHTDCIDGWLVHKAVCPVCQQSVKEFVEA